jgi:TRAP-type C4-dicarboxylate transport system substrate-binding protein
MEYVPQLDWNAWNKLSGEAQDAHRKARKAYELYAKREMTADIEAIYQRLLKESYEMK